MKEPWQEQLKWCKERYVPFMQFCGYEVDEKEVEQFANSFDLILHYSHANKIGDSIWYSWGSTQIPFCHGALLYNLSKKMYPVGTFPMLPTRSDWVFYRYGEIINREVSSYTYKELLCVLDQSEIHPVGTKGMVKSEDKYGDGFMERYEGILTRYLWWSQIPSFEVAPVVGQKNFHRLTYLYFLINDGESKENQFLNVKFVAKGE